ncbi:MAG: S49 family peptidase [Haloferacaceae archaeon]
MLASIKALFRRVAKSYVLFVVIGIVVGAALAPVAWDAAESDGTVAVVPLAGSIDGNSASSFTSMLSQARQDPDVEAVVVVSNSGGGAAAASEEQYLQMKRTAREMTVVTAVDASAASGAYYTVVPSDYIYAKPASIVGSVGVLANAPTDVEPNGLIATTGPNKLSGGDGREFYYLLETLGNAFYNAVYEQRGSQLELSRTELAQARIYSGAQAVQNGLVDDIGGTQAAIQKAAELEGLSNYDVRTMRPDGERRFLARSNYVASTVSDKRMIDSSYFVDDEASTPVFLMLPASYLDDADAETAGEPLTGTDDAEVANATR